MCNSYERGILIPGSASLDLSTLNIASVLTHFVGPFGTRLANFFCAKTAAQDFFSTTNDFVGIGKLLCLPRRFCRSRTRQQHCSADQDGQQQGSHLVHH